MSFDKFQRQKLYILEVSWQVQMIKQVKQTGTKAGGHMGTSVAM